MATLTTAEELFATAPKRRHKVVTLPVSGFTLRIQSLTEKEYADYLACFRDKSGNAILSRVFQSNRVFVSMCIVDQEGNRIITGDNVAKLETWDAADSQYLYNQCVEFVGLKATDVEVLEKNSGETPES